ncbi:hypothetical protein HanRHA438_Chr02g0058631 [Helianthus annuus]|uniref:Uncharacterized protein n=1 Tax=Helianthus annuus TaxID=4232 RepID=A0A9K3JMF3_HELAN|nr:hypothetical protein HanXRQr2_Chr02g0056771 [Helianthus annuus]KAJ0604178.1 hypothetical protein HanHA300_Chr02g0046771 [Helianthus annuus]KAJ0614619.1 hypothetical protein HanIR_Chr02g0064441 [Helianthus annuus]KAJ0618194.1 hypothetical protein HanHA89_Chr02g0050431 [Helianthus annuus]KAJ0776657.1 hypothetical protein HanLR1_Chr02g0048191 [Helianthus annuus]
MNPLTSNHLGPSPKKCSPRCVKTSYVLKYCCSGIEENYCCSPNEALCNKDCPTLDICCVHK